MKKINNKSFTLIELLLYLAIFAIVIGAVAQFGIKAVEWNKKANSRIVLEEETIAINRSLEESINKTISVNETAGQTIYDNNTGQLVLTLNDSTQVTYTKTGNSFTVKRGVAGTPVNVLGSRVNITKFFVEKIINKLNATVGVRISITLVTNTGEPLSRDVVTSYTFK